MSKRNYEQRDFGPDLKGSTLYQEQQEDEQRASNEVSGLVAGFIIVGLQKGFVIETEEGILTLGDAYKQLQRQYGENIPKEELEELQSKFHVITPEIEAQLSSQRAEAAKLERSRKGKEERAERKRERQALKNRKRA